MLIVAMNVFGVVMTSSPAPTPMTCSDALRAVGFEWSGDDLAALGAETLRRKIAFKEREGFDQLDVRIPGRILETPAPAGHVREEMIRETVRLVHELR